MNKKFLSKGYLIIDWGTTNFRVFLMDKSGELVRKKELALGLLHVKEGGFANALEGVLSQWLENYQALPIIMAGMVGSLQGWFNVDYVQTNVDKKQLAKKAYHFDLPWGAPAIIIPGVKHHLSDERYDVMRGEEVQILGLARLIDKTLFNAVLPGTHSKHIRVLNGQITEILSYMTGELFSIVTQNSILGKGLPEQKYNADVFLLGVKESKTNKLTNVLFAARTHLLFNNISDNEVHSYLSGLLIGYELRSVSGLHIYIVGSENLCSKYKLACSALSIAFTYVNGDECFLAGRTDLIKELSPSDNV
jgi:2-dehydro-3-deoxygalactonokinase